MLMPKKRFRFDHMYVYGSAAFILGFGAVMATIVHIAPVKVPNSNIALNTETQKTQEATVETTDTSEQNETDSSSAPTNPSPRNAAQSDTVSVPSAPTTNSAETNPESAQPEAPVETASPVVVDDPVTIPDSDPMQVVVTPGLGITIDLGP